MRNGAQTIFYGCTEEVLKELRRSEISSHFLVEYPDLPTLREMYSLYTKSALHDRNEIVILLPFYETTDSVRRILSEDSACIDVSKCEKEQALLVMDSLKGYFGSKDGLMPFVKRTANYAKSSGRTGVTVIGDMGSFFFYGKKDALIGWEMELTGRFETDLKGFCLYHMQDFKRLSEKDKQKLYRHHTRTLHLLPCPIGS